MAVKDTSSTTKSFPPADVLISTIESLAVVVQDGQTPWYSTQAPGVEVGDSMVPTGIELT